MKTEMLAPAVIRKMSKQVRLKLSKIAEPDKAGLQRKLLAIDREIENVTRSIAEIGGSAALHKHLIELEAERASVAADSESVRTIPRLTSDLEGALRQRIAALESIPHDERVDPELAHEVRLAVREVLGEVTVIEEGDSVIAEVDLGRVYINSGA